jgi:hypothetical protein
VYHVEMLLPETSMSPTKVGKSTARRATHGMLAYGDRVAFGFELGVARGVVLAGLLACSAVDERPGGEDPVPPASDDGIRVAGASAATSGGAAGRAGDSVRAGSGAPTGTAAGTAGSSGAAGTGAAAAPNVPDDAMLALAGECGLTETAMLFARCPAQAEVGLAACSLDDEPSPCSYFVFAEDDPSQLGLATFACQSECVALEGDSFWTNSCVQCGGDDCAPPTAASVVHELDVSDCEDRPSTPCVADQHTHQLTLDATLTALLPRESGAFSELHNAFLQVTIVDGCPSRFYVPGSSDPLERVSAVLGPALTGKRFECAVNLSCGRIQGPDTLGLL